jgi:hypothetical protein
MFRHRLVFKSFFIGVSQKKVRAGHAEFIQAQPAHKLKFITSVLLLFCES